LNYNHRYIGNSINTGEMIPRQLLLLVCLLPLISCLSLIFKDATTLPVRDLAIRDLTVMSAQHMPKLPGPLNPFFKDFNFRNVSKGRWLRRLVLDRQAEFLSRNTSCAVLRLQTPQTP
jgi:hypothetical protein